MTGIRDTIEAGAWRIQHFLAGMLGDSHHVALFWRIILTLLAIGAFLLCMMAATRLLRRVDAKLESWRGTRIPPLHIQTYEIISADRLTDMLKWLVRKFRLVVWVVALYIFIPLILSFFPPTRGLVTQYLDYLVAPIYRLFWGIIAFIPNLVFIAVVFLGLRYFLRILRVIFSEIQSGKIAFSGFHRDWAEPTFKLLRGLIVVLADPAPFVLQSSLNDFSITYELNAYTANVKELVRVQSELHQNIQDQFNTAGVEIMSPTYSALRDGNQVTIPEDYLPKSAPVRGFRFLPPGISGSGAGG